MEIDINKILEMYKGRVADLEHQLILQTVRVNQLEELLKKEKEDKQ